MRTSLEKSTFTPQERISKTLNSEHAGHERPDSLRRALMDPEKPLELPRGTVVVEVGPSALKASSYNAISQIIDMTPVSAFDNEKGYLELNGTAFEDLNAQEGKIALLYDSSVSPDEGMARIPAAVLVFELLTPEQIADLRAKLPEGVPLLDAKTNNVIGVEPHTVSDSLSSTDYEGMGGAFGAGGGTEMSTVYMEPERPKEGETSEEFEERRAKQRQKEEEDRTEREAREEERKRQEAAESIVRGEEIERQVREEWEAEKRAEAELKNDIERRAQEIRDARKATEEALRAPKTDQTE